MISDILESIGLGFRASSIPHLQPAMSLSAPLQVSEASESGKEFSNHSLLAPKTQAAGELVTKCARSTEHKKAPYVLGCCICWVALTERLNWKFGYCCGSS